MRKGKPSVFSLIGLPFRWPSRNLNPGCPPALYSSLISTHASCSHTRRPQLLSLGMEFANLEDLALTLPGIERERVRMPRAMLLQLVGVDGWKCEYI